MIIGKSGSVNIFDNNNSKAHGGAIVAKAVDGEGEDSSVIINGTTTFNSNQATVNGGAIWNNVAEKSGTTGNADLVFNGATTFNGNKSLNGLGGALYNTGTNLSVQLHKKGRFDSFILHKAFIVQPKTKTISYIFVCTFYFVI